MVASLDGVIFDQVYGDNSGGAEFDTDGDGTATQEDEFISFTNTSGSEIDISGWQIWVAVPNGSGAPDDASDGLYHTFEAGTTLSPGQSLFVINEITGTDPGWAQESSVGGTESGSGGASTNFLSEGNGSPSHSDSVALVNPDTGEYIVFNAGSGAEEVSSVSGFTGTTSVGEVDAQSVQDDQAAGYSYQYDSGTDSYVYDTVFVPCFVPGTLITTKDGPRAVETLRSGDLILTKDSGFRRLRHLVMRVQDIACGADDPNQYPVEFKPGSLGDGLPEQALRVSPNHRMLWRDETGEEHLIPAKAFLDRPKVRSCKGVTRVTYCHLVFDSHQIIESYGVWSESFLMGKWATRRAMPSFQNHIARVAPALYDAPAARHLASMRSGKAILSRAAG